ncbi:hypothetical protein [Chiayiivirga flava]|uniref:Uncharacterized protein n=1 Tax=Chiayiivirga flava TaxID=659595 RepID=A0A7W8D4P9_9GAMM|nr:hypothetical protein [Chiayiivirga flava]MBB5207895.1 hypothetical protein [Chiayiivirga flava]
MFIGSAHAWLIRAPDDPRLSARQQVSARLLPPYAAYLLLLDAYHALTYPPAVREAQRYCEESLQAQGYAEWTRMVVCECHALEGKSLDVCFARH